MVTTPRAALPLLGGSTLFTGLCAFAASALWVGCSSSVDDTPPPDCTVYTWEPGTGDLSSFPTREMLVEDPSTRTGYRWDVTAEAFPEVASFGRLATLFTRDAAEVDGVGLQADAWMTFATADGESIRAGALPRGDGTVRVSDPFGILVFPEDGDAQLWPVDARRGARGDVVFVQPMLPLPEGVRVAYFATSALAASTTTGCVAPSAGMRRAMRLPDDDRRAALTALTELGVIASYRDLVALHVVTTQVATRVSRDVAAHIQGLVPRLTDHVCRDEGDHRVCDATLAVEDYRDDEGVIRVAPNAAPAAARVWDLDVRIWLPDASVHGEGPYPTIIHGHGFGQDVSAGDDAAALFSAEGIATVAIDAVVHGTHPRLDGTLAEGPTEARLRFFTVDTGSIDALRVRDHWRQSAYDKLQLLQALIQQGDLDGDGDADVDAARVGYYGFSMGGVMANELAALTPDLSVVVNYVGGGRYSSILDDPQSIFRQIFSLLLGISDRDRFTKAAAVLQTVVEAGDAAVYGAHILHDRFEGMGTPPDYLFGVALNDDTVNNRANYALARALQIPLVGTVSCSAPGVAVEERALPLVDNLGEGSGAFTAGLLQYDVTDMDGTRADHDIPATAVGVAGWLPFLRSHFVDGSATLTDPFVSEGIAHTTDPTLCFAF